MILTPEQFVMMGADELEQYETDLWAIYHRIPIHEPLGMATMRMTLSILMRVQARRKVVSNDPAYRYNSEYQPTSVPVEKHGKLD